MGEYCLGTSDHELARLGLQQEVWGGLTDAFLDSLGIRPGWRALDVGCGPGYLVEDLCGRVGPGGEVVALDESPRWIEHVRRVAKERGWANVEPVLGRVEDAPLEPGSLDLVFMRWVLGFLPAPGAVVEGLAAALRPGGVLAVIDYNHEGISVFPEREGFRAAVRATRRFYEKRGGDPWVMGGINGLFLAAGLEPFRFEPMVIAGGPGSPAFRWLDAFFPFHTRGFVEEGVMSEAERERFLADWAELGSDPSSTFFSPIVVGAAARKP